MQRDRERQSKTLDSSDSDAAFEKAIRQLLSRSSSVIKGQQQTSLNNLGWDIAYKLIYTQFEPILVFTL